jgi:hypothetical protein
LIRKTQAILCVLTSIYGQSDGKRASKIGFFEISEMPIIKVVFKLMYTSTRDNSVRVSAAQAIANGISKDGGLFVPTQIPTLTADELKELGADVTWDEIEGYGHEWRFWDIEVEKFLDWLPREDAYAKKGKRAI